MKVAYLTQEFDVTPSHTVRVRFLCFYLCRRVDVSARFVLAKQGL